MSKFWKPALLIAALAIMVIGMLGSGAWFTDQATTANPTALSSGSLSIENGLITNVSLGAIPNMAPGDLTAPIEIVIKNDGNLNLAWFGDLEVGSSVLKDVIYIDTAKMEYLSSTGTAWEPTDTFITNGKGSGSWPTTWTGPENYATLNVYDGNSNMAPGTPYEFMGALKPGYQYKLTLKFGFYPGAGNEYQNAGPLTIGFKVQATQINATAMEAIHSTLGNHFAWMNQQIAKQP